MGENGGEKPILKQDGVSELSDRRFLHFYDFSYFPGSHYYAVSRREKSALTALCSEEEFRRSTPDAVSCVVILECKGESPKLLLTKEMRYPVGQFLLGVPAGLLDPEDRQEENPVFCAAVRELREETGIKWMDGDEMKMINPLLFSSPGMTDESNAVVQMKLYRERMPELTAAGAVGGECFEGFVLLDREEAGRVLREGIDGDGYFYSVYTWIALVCFVSGMWN